MRGKELKTSFLKSEPFFIWVLAPHLETDDPNLQFYYDFEQNKAEFTRALEALNLPWKWQYVTIKDYKSVIDHIASSTNGQIPIVFNLCDGDEVNGTPGISVVRYLEQKDVIYTGARETYYHLTTSKITMKQAFERAGVPTAPWVEIRDRNQDLKGLCKQVGSPIIVKPAVSGGSMGLGVKNVVTTDEELEALVKELYDGYHGWDLCFGGLVAEKFIPGQEFTTLIVGSHDQPDHAIIFQPIERVFNQKLPENERFLSFDRLWETYEFEAKVGEKADGDYEDFYDYYLPAPELEDEIRKLSWDAYCAVEGTGYTRVDLRKDSATGKYYVLELNSQCGLSEDEAYTSIGAIVRLGKHPFSEIIRTILENALATKIKSRPFRFAAAYNK